jgi:methionyl-tRNA formyltransferase
MEEMIIEIMEKEPAPRDQQGQVTVFKRRTSEQGDLAAVCTLDEAFDMIRMLDAEGYPRAFLNVGPLRLEFSRAARKVDRVVADVQISLPAAKMGTGKSNDKDS